MTHIEEILAKYEVPRRTGLANSTIEEVEVKTGISLPKDYTDFLTNYQGFEKLIGEEYVQLWDLEDLVEQNEGYLILENLPATIGIGSNGAGELIALERVNEEEVKVVLTPFVDLSQDYHIPIGDSFTDFLQRLDKGQEWFDEAEG
ncbi:hypothetical protein TH61_05315 [Rufibacter sp. DG15C]|uniref:SMI1/KNR4 family protein n=1 Tax=Rufibacter sp. DG15C TaxID=1379909 RepID=UPI00078D7E4B|nr:SMI1/KNR4 family protein [Rufibacter sp. DG15C]AMM50711.1 hypothetical protein TH61_05315 [Rufibacter sp. DG15C]